MARNDLIQFRRGTAAQWTTANPVLAEGEMGFETDTGKLKVGDGAAAWSALTYINGDELDASSWDGLTGKPAVVAAGATQADARNALGATTVGSTLLTAASATAARRTVGAQDESASGAMRGLMSKLTRGVTDAAWVNVGDSTGNETWEWVYLTAQWLAAKFPSYTVQYYLWDATGGTTYLAPVTIQTGTGTGNAGGPFTLTVWNASVAGSTTGYFQGSRYVTAFVDKKADLLTVNYGHNQGGPVDTDSALQFQRNKYLAFLDEYVTANPLAGVVCMLQNPSIENPSAAPGRPFVWVPQRLQQFEVAARWRGWGVIDVFQAFVDNPTWAADYVSADGLHPNAAGQTVWAAQVTAALERAAKVSVTTQPATASAPGRQIIVNPEFGTWTASNPDGVTMSTTPPCVASKELTNKETGAWAMKLTTDATAGMAYAQIVGGTADAIGIKGLLADQTWTAAVRVFVPVSNASTVRVTLSDNNGFAQSVVADVDATCRGRYCWVYVTKKFASNATSLFLQVSPRTSGTAIVSVDVDRVYLFPGAVPYPNGGTAPVVQVGASSVTFGGGEVQVGAEANMDRANIDGAAYCSNATQIALFAYFTAKQNITINNLQAVTGSTAAAATPTLCKLAVYSVDAATGDLTQIGVTASNTALFAATFTEYTQALLAPVNLVKGQSYAYAVLQVSSAAVATLVGKGGAGLANQHFRAPRLSALRTAQTDLAASYLAGTIAVKSGVPYICGTT